jgi:hypothetical protein
VLGGGSGDPFRLKRERLIATLSRPEAAFLFGPIISLSATRFDFGGRAFDIQGIEGVIQ